MARNYDSMAKRMPPFALAYTIRFAGGCSAERLAAGQQFFTAARRGPGFETEEAKVVDRVTDCLALRKHEGDGVRKYLETINAPK